MATTADLARREKPGLVIGGRVGGRRGGERAARETAGSQGPGPGMTASLQTGFTELFGACCVVSFGSANAPPARPRLVPCQSRFGAPPSSTAQAPIPVTWK